MKNISFLLLILLMGIMDVVAQQQGEVKTIGRYNHPGQKVSGVIIRTKGRGNPVVSDENGRFLLVLKGAKEGDAYSYESINKPNYEILDRTLLGRDIAFSSTVPFTIVLVDKIAMNQERVAMQARYEKKFEERYNSRLAQIESKYTSQVISLEQMIDSLQNLNVKYEQSKSQANEIIEYYIRVDYDQLDSLDREINYLIEQGEFEDARILIFSKGDIEERMQKVESLQHMAKKETQSLVHDLLNLYEISMANVSFFEANNFAKKAYTLAPENYDAIVAYTNTLIFTNSFGSEWQQMEKTLFRYVSSHFGEDSEEYLRSLFRMEGLYRNTFNSDSCIVYLNKILSIMDAQDSIDAERMDHTLTMLSYHYSKVGDIRQVMKILKRRETILKKNNRLEDMFHLYTSYSSVFFELNEPKKAKIYDQKAIECFEQMDSPSSDLNSIMVTKYTLYNQNDKALALALANVDVIFSENGNRIDTQISRAYEEIASVYASIRDYDNAILYQIKSVEADDSFSQKKMFSSVFRRLYLAELYDLAGNTEMLTQTLDEISTIYHNAGVSGSLVDAYNLRLSALQKKLHNQQH